MDFTLMYRTWIDVVTKPNEATYREEAGKPHATLLTALIWIVIASVILAILSAIAVIVNGVFYSAPAIMQSLFEGADVSSEMNDPFARFELATTGVNFIFSLVLTPIVTPIVFFIGATIYFFIAKLLGGVGDYEKHTYMLAAFSAPLLVANGAVSIIPFVGGCISFAIFFYQIVLTYFAIKTVHELSPVKAILVALTPLLIFTFCTILFFVTFSAIFLAAELSA